MTECLIIFMTLDELQSNRKLIFVFLYSAMESNSITVTYSITFLTVTLTTQSQVLFIKIPFFISCCLDFLKYPLNSYSIWMVWVLAQIIAIYVPLKHWLRNIAALLPILQVLHYVPTHKALNTPPAQICYLRYKESFSILPPFLPHIFLHNNSSFHLSPKHLAKSLPDYSMSLSSYAKGDMVSYEDISW